MAFDPSTAQEFEPAARKSGSSAFDPSTAKIHEPTVGGEFKKGIASGIDNLLASGYGFAGMSGDFSGIEPLKNWGLEGYVRKNAEADANAPAIGRVEDVGGVKDAALYAAQGLGSLVPFMASSVASGGIGAGLGQLAVRKGVEKGIGRAVASGIEPALVREAAKDAMGVAAERGAITGAGAQSIGVEQGSIYGDIYDKTGKTDAGTAATYGVGAGLLDVLPEARLIHKVARGKKSGLAGDLAKQIGLEGATEGAQTIVERGAVAHVDPSKEVFSPEGISEILNAAVIGGLGGGVAGAGGHLYTKLANGKHVDTVDVEDKTAPDLPTSKDMPMLALPDKRVFTVAPDGTTWTNQEAFQEAWSKADAPQRAAWMGRTAMPMPANPISEDQANTLVDGMSGAVKNGLQATRDYAPPKVFDPMTEASVMGKLYHAAKLEQPHLDESGPLADVAASAPPAKLPAGGPMSRVVNRGIDAGVTSLAPAPGAAPQSRRSPVVTDERGKVIGMAPEHVPWVGQAKSQQDFDHAVLALQAHAKDPQLVERALAAPDLSSAEEKTIFKRIINGQGIKNDVIDQKVTELRKGPGQQAQGRTKAGEPGGPTAKPVDSGRPAASGRVAATQPTAGAVIHGNEPQRAADRAGRPNAAEPAAKQSAGTQGSEKAKARQGSEGQVTQRGRKPTKAEQRTAATRAHLEAHFTPGNIVKGYGGHDRVLGFTWNDGKWHARVEEVTKRDGQWVTTDRPRTHSTPPSKGDGVVEAAPAATKANDSRAKPPVSEIVQQGDRRHDATTRKKVDQMSTREMRRALLTDDLTGLKNARALAEDQLGFSHVIAFDADSLKWVNDSMGHEGGDELLKAWGRAIAQATENGYRKSGDEFFALAGSKAEAQTIAAKVENLLSQAVITAETPSGERITINGIGVSYGIGQDLKSADTKLIVAKRERETAGKRAGRGQEPPGVTREAAARVENPVGKTADRQVAEKPASKKTPAPAGVAASTTARTKESVMRDLDTLVAIAEKRMERAKDPSIKALRPTATDWMTPVEMRRYEELQAELVPFTQQDRAAAQARVKAKRAARVEAEKKAAARDALDEQGAEKRGALGGGSTREQVREWLAEPIKNIRVPVSVARDIGEARTQTGLKNLASDTVGVALGGKITLVASNIRDRLGAEKAIFHELFHAALRAKYRKDIAGYAKALRAVGNINANVREAAAKWTADFGADAKRGFLERGMTEAEANEALSLLGIEEALADMSGEQGAEIKLKGLREVVATVQRYLRKIGLNRLADWMESMSNAEALDMIAGFREHVTSSEPHILSPATAPAYMRDAPVFYSELTRQVAAVKTESAPAVQWKATIKNLRGVKADEIQWSGLNEWLDMQQGKVTKQQVSDFLAQNGVRVEETMLGENGQNRRSIVDQETVHLTSLGFDPLEDPDGAMFGIRRLRDGKEFFFNVGEAAEKSSEEVSPENVGLEVVNVASNLADLRETHLQVDNPEATKFDQYALPGGENYRELLLTLPERAGGERGPKGWGDSHGGTHDTANFRSSHFDQPNILAHVRFDERADADGKRVLFIEEIQSDWAQKGKREGFAGAESDPERVRAFVHLTKAEWDAAPPALRASYAEQYKKTERGVPAGPFVGKTEAWVALAVKRMIRYAAEHGFDRMAFTTGEQQTARYDLSKHIGAILYKEGERGGSLTAFDPAVRRVAIERDGVAPKDLPDLIGKDAAEKLMRVEPNAKGIRELRGLDLKVGGEGMHAFYDKIVPNVVNDVLKKMGGERVGTVEIPNVKGTGRSMVVDDGPSFGGRRTIKIDDEPHYQQRGFDITPQMRVLALDGMPVFSRATVMESSPMVERFRKEAASLWESPRTFNIFHRTVGTQQHKAKVDHDFGRVFNVGQAYLQDVAQIANDPADLAPHVLPQIRDLKDALKFAKTASKVDLQHVSSAVFQGTLEDKVFEPAELAARFKMTEKQIEQYQEVRAAIDRSLDQLVTSEAARLARKEGLGHALEAARNTPEHGPEIIRNALAQQAQALDAKGDKRGAHNKRVIAGELLAKAAKIKDLKAKGYAPLQRFGQYTVYVTRDGGKDQVYFGMYETKRAANLAREALTKEFPDADVVQGVLSQDAYKIFQGLTPDTLELFGDVATVGPDGKAVKLGETELFQQYLKLAVNNRSAMKRLIQRKGVAGFSEDVSRVLSQFITSNARAASGNYHFGDMLEAVSAIPKEKGDVKDEAVKLMRYLQDPKEEASQLRGFLFIQYLGGSIASALTNMTQPILMSFPYLAQWGTARAAAALSEASMLAATGKKITDPELAAAIAKAVQDGVIAPQEIHQLQAEAMHSFGSNIHLRKGLALWGSLFSLAEQFNRKATFIAAFRIAKAEGMADPFTFAEEAVKETQGIYNRGNRPDWARGPIGATLFTFKQFSIAYIEFLKRLPPKQRALALAILVLAAGVQGLPFADDLDDLVDTVAQSLGYSWNTKQKKRQWLSSVLGADFAGFLMFGGSALPGVPLDVQGRLGLGNLIPGSGLFKRSTTDKTKDLTEALGPVGGFAKSLSEAAGKLQEGDWGGALGKAAPLAVQNALKGMEMAQMGMYRDQKGRKVMNTDAYDAFIKTVGFQPSKVATESRKMQESQQNVALVREVEREISDKWAQGIFEKDRPKIDQAIAALKEWNQTNPATPIAIHQSQIQKRVKDMSTTREVRAIKAVPKEARGEIAKELR